MTGFSPKVRQIIQDRADEICERCSLRPVSEHHHRRPRGSGGSRRADTNTPANAAGLCSECHLRCERYRSEALDLGWLVPQGIDPSTVPVYYRQSDWVLLEEDGSITYV